MISLAPELALSLVPSITDFCAKPKRKIITITWRQPSLASTLSGRCSCRFCKSKSVKRRVRFIFLQVVFISRHHVCLGSFLGQVFSFTGVNVKHELFAVFNGLLFGLLPSHQLKLNKAKSKWGFVCFWKTFDPLTPVRCHSLFTVTPMGHVQIFLFVLHV